MSPPTSPKPDQEVVEVMADPVEASPSKPRRSTSSNRSTTSKPSTSKEALSESPNAKKDDSEKGKRDAATLESLITSLRASLASSQTLLSTQATRLSQLSNIETEHGILKDQLAFVSAAKEAVEEKLKIEVQRREESEERVEALRGQVEQARRGVMTLQKQEKERKRMSMLPNTAGLGALGLQNPSEELDDATLTGGGTSTANKRQSVMMPRGHRRISSNSEPDVTLLSPTERPSGSALGTTPPGANSGSVRPGLRELRLGAGSANTTTISASTSPQPSFSNLEDPYLPTATKTSPPLKEEESPSKATMELKAENERIRMELTSVELKLAESEESRQASEAVLKALREFISGGLGVSPGIQHEGVVDLNDPETIEELRGISLPPLPTDPDRDDSHLINRGDVKGSQRKLSTSSAASGNAVSGGWGFKLWPTAGMGKIPPMSPSSQTVEPPQTPYGGTSSPPASIRSSTISELQQPQSQQLNEANLTLSPPQNSTPLANFVSSWTKGISPGTPGPNTLNPASTNNTPQAQHPGNARSFSSFFGRKKAADEKEKELPKMPDHERDEDEVGSVGAEKVDEVHVSKLPQQVKEVDKADEVKDDLEGKDGSAVEVGEGEVEEEVKGGKKGLEPSLMSDQEEKSADVREEGQEESTEGVVA